jgi:SH3-like domain-containing protein
MSQAAQALEYKSVGANPAILYDAPSAKGKKLFIAPRGMPVEIVLSYGEWTKVRDASGGLAWIEAKTLVSKRNIIVQTASAKVRANPDDAAFINFTAEKGVLLELQGERTTNGWLKVKHREGQIGFVKATEVWGE